MCYEMFKDIKSTFMWYAILNIEHVSLYMSGLKLHILDSETSCSTVTLLIEARSLSSVYSCCWATSCFILVTFTCQEVRLVQHFHRSSMLVYCASFYNASSAALCDSVIIYCDVAEFVWQEIMRVRRWIRCMASRVKSSRSILLFQVTLAYEKMLYAYFCAAWSLCCVVSLSSDVSESRFSRTVCICLGLLQLVVTVLSACLLYHVLLLAN